MDDITKHPLHSVENFEKWLGGIACVCCKHLNKTGDDIEKWKCKLESTQYYPDGIEESKEWIRNFDKEREAKGDRSLPLPRRDVNLFFVCDEFDDNID